MASQCSVELSALVEKACEAYHIRQDGLLDLYYLEDIIYAIGIREKDVTEEVYGYVGQAEEENQYFININLAVSKIVKIIQSRENTETKLPSILPLSSPKLNGIGNKTKPSAIPPLPQTSPLSSPEFDQDEFAERMLEDTYQLSLTPEPTPVDNLPTSTITRQSHKPRDLHTIPNSRKTLGLNWKFEESSQLPPYIIQLPTVNRKESRDPRIRSRLKRQQAKEKAAIIQID